MNSMGTAELSHLEEGGLPFVTCIDWIRSPQVGGITSQAFSCRQGYSYKPIVANTHGGTEVGITTQ